jgi:SAM-dependent methyltransferase
MIELEREIVDQVFGVTRAVQFRYDHTQKPEKVAAKKRAAALLTERLPAGGRLLDVGGEEFYHVHLSLFEIVTHNLPENDMHTINYREEFDAVLAMHVLEHSPFPLLVLTLIRRALKPGGFLYVAVPRPCDKFCRKFGHWSVMRARMWMTLIAGAGLKIVHQELGKFGPKKEWVEERFLCQRPA